MRKGKQTAGDPLIEKKKDQLLHQMLKQLKASDPDMLKYPVPEVFSKKTGSLMLSLNDILSAKETIERLVNIKKDKSPDKNSVIKSSLWHYSVLLYSHCFNSNESGHSSLEANDMFKNADDKQFLSTHERLMYLRNSFIAHRGDTELEKSIVIMCIPNDNETVIEKNEGILFKIRSVKTTAPSQKELLDYLNLFNYVIKMVEQKIKKATEKMKEPYLKHFTPEQINLMLINNMRE